VYRDSEFSADMGSRAVNRIEDVSMLRTVQFAEDSGPMAHSVRPESYMEIANFYTVTIYEKGAEVVRMQANLLGPETFRQGTDRYFEKYDGMAVTTEDFVSTMEEVSSLDLEQFRRWYSQAGTPKLDITGHYDADLDSFTLSISQTCPPTPSQPDKAPFYIPLRMGLINEAGEPVTLHVDDYEPGTDVVLHISEAEEDFVFQQVGGEPVPALLREFSAPVKLAYPYTRDELMLLMQHEEDGFVRWEAGQQLALQVIDDLLQARNQDKPYTVDERLVTAFATVLNSALTEPGVDKAMLAHLLLLPSEAYLAELAEEVDVDGIHAVREFLRHYLAEKLESAFVSVYESCASDAEYEYCAPEMARRSLRNTTLNYLACLDKPAHWERVQAQYENANNMTDSSAALRALVSNPTPDSEALRESLIKAFYEKWQHETLVVEQWLSMQCVAMIPDNLPRVKALMEHPAFDIRNPNKVRCVIGAFCFNNAVGFHQLDGSGYEFLADQIITLNGINPQIASRLLTPLTRWKKFSRQRQDLMQTALRRILAEPNLSPDVYEVVSKSLQ